MPGTRHTRSAARLAKKAAVETQRQKLDALDGEHMRMVLERHGNDSSTMAGGGLCLRALRSEELLGKMCVGLAWRRHSKVVLKERGDLKTIMMHGVEDSWLMGKYVEDGEAHGSPRYKLCHEPDGLQYYLFRWTDGRWMVGNEERIGTGDDCFFRSTTTDARLPLNLRWEKRTSNLLSWLPVKALTTTDIVPTPPQNIVMQGHTGTHAKLMGVYDLEKKKEVNGMPLFKSRHTPCGSGKLHAFLYRASSGAWAVGLEGDIAEKSYWIKSATYGALSPVGLAWEWADDEAGWHSFECRL